MFTRGSLDEPFPLPGLGFWMIRVCKEILIPKADHGETSEEELRAIAILPGKTINEPAIWECFIPLYHSLPPIYDDDWEVFVVLLYMFLSAFAQVGYPLKNGEFQQGICAGAYGFLSHTESHSPGVQVTPTGWW